jgi:hypothetical protein
MSDARQDPGKEKEKEREEQPVKPEEAKKAYEKPSFQHERVFETMALACGKLSPTQFQCRFNRKNS